MASVLPVINMFRRLAEVACSWPLRAASPSSSTSSVEVPLLHLPADHALSFLDTLALPPDVVEGVKPKVVAAISELQALHLKNFQLTCRTFLESPAGRTATPASRSASLNFLKQSFEASFQQKHPKIQDGFMKVLEQVRQTDSEPRRFNHDFAPLLHEYFEYQPFPSSRDREWLAQKTGNTVEQIATWFQNHRRRAKEAGRVIERLPHHLQPTPMTLEDLEIKLSPFLTRTRSESVESDSTSATPPPEQSLSRRSPTPPSSSNALFNSTSPPSHAFPTKFEPNARSQPYQFQCDPLVWRRKRSTKRPRYEPYTIDKCCDDFQTSVRITGKAKNHKRSAQPWFGLQSIGPLPAPHPASLSPLRMRQSSTMPTICKESSRLNSSSRRRSSKPYDFHNDATSPLSCRYSRVPNTRSPISRMASNSSITSSGSSASEGDGPVTPPASPVASYIGLPDDEERSQYELFRSEEPSRTFTPKRSPFSLSSIIFGEPTLPSCPQLSQKRFTSTRSLLSRYGFAKFSDREATLLVTHGLV